MKKVFLLLALTVSQLELLVEMSNLIYSSLDVKNVVGRRNALEMNRRYLSALKVAREKEKTEKKKG